MHVSQFTTDAKVSARHKHAVWSLQASILVLAMVQLAAQAALTGLSGIARISEVLKTLSPTGMSKARTGRDQKKDVKVKIN